MRILKVVSYNGRCGRFELMELPATLEDEETRDRSHFPVRG